MKTLLPSLVVGSLLLASCGSTPARSSDAPSQPAASQAADPMTATDVSSLGLPNFTQPMEGLVCTGQLAPEQMDQLAALGYGFISLRAADEKGAGWEEAHAEAQGINFQRMTVKGAAGVTEAAAKDLAARLDAADGPTVLYCGSSNRVGALVALKAYHLEGMAAEDALALGKSAGVTGIEPKLKELLGL